jgi:hypothetical protein
VPRSTTPARTANRRTRARKPASTGTICLPSALLGLLALLCLLLALLVVLLSVVLLQFLSVLEHLVALLTAILLWH